MMSADIWTVEEEGLGGGEAWVLKLDVDIEFMNQKWFSIDGKKQLDSFRRTLFLFRTCTCTLTSVLGSYDFGKLNKVLRKRAHFGYVSSLKISIYRV